MRHPLLLIFCLISTTIAPAQQPETNIKHAWDMVWTRFYLPKVQTFGDYLSSYEKGKEQAHLPTAEEV